MNLLTYYYLPRIGFLVFILLCCAAVALYMFLRRRWQRRQETLERELAENRASNYEKLHGDLRREIAHEYTKALDFILTKSTETLEGLGKEQIDLREKQNEIIAKVSDLIRHMENILAVFAPKPDELTWELVNIRQLIETELKELFPYAESRGVTLRVTLMNIEPVILDRGLTSLAVRNVVHNAIKYSRESQVVDVELTLEEDEAQQEKVIFITVTDRGRGIKDADKETIFEKNRRGDGLIEPGHGLGLFLARKAARLQGGDVILVSSVLNEGSVFRIILPFTEPASLAQETKAKAAPPRRTRTPLTWGAAIAGLLASMVLLFVLFKPPQTVELVTYHAVSADRYEARWITALGEDLDWTLTQELKAGGCSRFYLIPRGDKVALLTCNDRFITAPRMPNPGTLSTQHDSRWRLWQDTGLGECGLFTIEDRPNDPNRPGDLVAFRTCSDMVITAADGNWEGEMAWAVVAETGVINTWEEIALDLLTWQVFKK